MLFQALRLEAAKKIEVLSSRLEELKHKKRVTEDVVEGAIRRNDEIKDQLQSNENYRQISHLEERLADMMAEGKTLQSTRDQMKKVFLPMHLASYHVIECRIRLAGVRLR